MSHLLCRPLDHYTYIVPVEFTVAFLLLGQDQTRQVCDSFRLKLNAEQDEQAKSQLQGEWNLHKARAQNAYHQLKEDTLYVKSNPKVLLLSFDL